MAETRQSSRNSRNWLLIKFRQWHTWLGVVLSLVIVTICLSGIYLNHKELFEPAFQPAKAERSNNPPGPSMALTTATRLSSLPISFEQALAQARDHWGDGVALDRIELKNERGQAIYKIKSPGRPEILIDAQTGGLVEKTPKSQVSKFLRDLHTGQILGLTGKLGIDITSLSMVALTATGSYLWFVSIRRKRKNSLQRSAARQQPLASLRSARVS